MGGWDDSLAVQTGASAGLAGPIFAGHPINLERLLRVPDVLLRAVIALVTLIGILVTSTP
ncbi:MAG TPA: hypothetical protein VD789_00700 [Thermomicrobiales bacterium]|nr:hypothetical protein [Thermomicrobiales bacterium]